MEDSLIAYRWQDVVEVFAVLFLFGTVGVMSMVLRKIEGDFYLEAPVFVVMLTAGALAIFALLSFVSRNLSF